jgi:hypothetical protein
MHYIALPAIPHSFMPLMKYGADPLLQRIRLGQLQISAADLFEQQIDELHFKIQIDCFEISFQQALIT